MISVTQESKNSTSVTNEGKTGQDATFADSEEKWAETGPAGDTWLFPGTPVRKESKNNVTVINESKN